MKKTTKKTKKPDYIVYMDNMTSLDDIDVEFGMAKQEAGLPMTDGEFAAICHYIADNAAPKFTFVNCICEKKKTKKVGVFKRFWRWITRKK